MTEYTENYRGCDIEVVLDECPPNPFEDWDCEPPIAVYANYNRGVTEYATQYGNVDSFDWLTRKQIIEHKSLILDSLGCDSWRAVLRGSFYIESDAEAYVRECLANLGDSDRLELLGSLYNACGIPAVVKSVSGYSQGDYAEVLAVATPEFRKASGNPEGFDWIACLNGSIDLFRNWAYGNVYGFVVALPDGETESCYGFYGDYDSTYGALSEARSVVDHAIDRVRQDHYQAVKSWIRNRVPLVYRTALDY